MSKADGRSTSLWGQLLASMGAFGKLNEVCGEMKSSNIEDKVLAAAAAQIRLPSRRDVFKT